MQDFRPMRYRVAEVRADREALQRIFEAAAKELDRKLAELQFNCAHMNSTTAVNSKGVMQTKCHDCGWEH